MVDAASDPGESPISAQSHARANTYDEKQGSTYIYVEHLHPFLSAHESEIDQALADAQNKAKKAGLEWLNTIAARIRELVVGSLNVSISCWCTQLKRPC